MPWLEVTRLRQKMLVWVLLSTHKLPHNASLTHLQHTFSRQGTGCSRYMKQAELRSRSGLKGGHRVSFVGRRMEQGALWCALPMKRTSRSEPMTPATGPG